MSLLANIDTILELKLSGRLAHFRKFYTNASSLTYSIPPRTSICGLVGSILELPRDTYYETLSSEKLGVAIALSPKSEFHKQFFTMNYMGDDKCINNASAHKQCRMELLMPASGIELCWYVYLGYSKASDSPLSSLKERLINHNLGYGVYLGQRQFRADIHMMNEYTTDSFQFLNESDYVDTAVVKDSVVDFAFSSHRISVERMPLDQELETRGKINFRRSVRLCDVMIETSGNRLKGSFTGIIELKNEDKTRISFL